MCVSNNAIELQAYHFFEKQFAKGELCYKEYLLAKKDHSRNMLWYTSAFTVFFITTAWAFINYFQ